MRNISTPKGLAFDLDRRVCVGWVEVRRLPDSGGQVSGDDRIEGSCLGRLQNIEKQRIKVIWPQSIHL